MPRKGSVSGPQTAVCFTCGSSFDYIKVRGYRRFCSETCTNRAEVLKKFGMKPSDFNALVEKQQGLCAICGNEPGAKGFHVDHNHACCPTKGCCGKCVRALLCNLCNAGLGQFRDDVELLQKAINYLKGFEQ
jgi:hypothetical protein